VGEAVAKHKNTPADILAILTGDENFLVRLKVADNTHTPPEVLSRLAEKANRHELASNKNTPPEVLAYLAKDTDASLLREAGRFMDDSSVRRPTR